MTREFLEGSIKIAPQNVFLKSHERISDAFFFFPLATIHFYSSREFSGLQHEFISKWISCYNIKSATFKLRFLSSKFRQFRSSPNMLLDLVDTISAFFCLPLEGLCTCFMPHYILPLTAMRWYLYFSARL